MLSRNIFKPWGKLGWILEKMPTKNWDFLGCLSTENRCISTFRYLKENNLVDKSFFFEIIDPSDTSVHRKLRDENLEELKKLDLGIAVENHQLLEPLSNIVESVQNLREISKGSLILDISSFPKRFFFPILKFLLKGNHFDNLIVSYSSASEYSKENLAENPQPWMNIPPFKADDDDGTEEAIVGLGFMPLGLPDVLGNDNNQKKTVNLLCPFPVGPPAYQRTWSFIKEINEYRSIHPKELIRIDALNVPEVFDKICAITDFGRKRVIFAPYGPKPISLAMCLHACESNSSVYYTQPMSYNPNYSVGTSEIHAYCIIVNSQPLYKL